MKNLLKPILFSLIAFLIIGCQKEELPNTENDLSKNAKSWYDQKHSQKLNENLFFHGEPDWDNYSKIGDEIYFPIISDFKNDGSKINLNKNSNWSYIRPYLILVNIGENNFEESLKIFVSSNKNALTNNSTTFNLPHLQYDSNNNRVTNSHTGKNNKDGGNTRLPSFLETSSKSSGCETYYVIETTYDNGNPVAIEVLYSYELCGGGGDGNGGGGGIGIGGGGGDGGSLPTADENRPPDCASFQYESVSNLWKATVAKGLSFKVRVLVGSHTTNSIDHDINFGNELFTFQTWKEDRFSNELGDAEASIVSAFAVDQAIKKTTKELKHRYGISKLQIEQHFKQVLKIEFANYTGGGRVEIGNPFGLTPVQFRHNWFGYGDCN